MELEWFKKIELDWLVINNGYKLDKYLSELTIIKFNRIGKNDTFIRYILNKTPIWLSLYHINTNKIEEVLKSIEPLIFVNLYLVDYKNDYENIYLQKMREIKIELLIGKS